MYGTDVAASSASTLALTGALATQSQILAFIAAGLIGGGATLTIVRRWRLKGKRP